MSATGNQTPPAGGPQTGWLAVLAAVLSALERLVPALLVFWAKSSDNEAERLRARATIAEAKLEGEKDAAGVSESVQGLGRRPLLDHMVGRLRARRDRRKPTGEPPA